MKLVKEDHIEMLKSGEFVARTFQASPLDSTQLSLNACDDMGISLRLAISESRAELQAFVRRLPKDAVLHADLQLVP